MRLKLVFPNGEVDPVHLEQGEVRVGASDDCAIQLTSAGIGLNHAQLSVADGVITVSVENKDNVTKVNNELVASSKPAKPGDLLAFSSVKCRVVAIDDSMPAPKQEQASSGDDGHTVIRQALPKFMLRGVSGTTFGRVFPLKGTTVLGRHSDCDVHVSGNEVSRHHCKIHLKPNGLTIEDLGSANGTYVNGKRVDNSTTIKPGDELRIDNVRFMVLTPGMEVEAVKKKDAEVKSSTAKGGLSGTAKTAIIVTAVLAVVVVGLLAAGVI